MKWKSLFAAALSAVVAWPALAQGATGGGTPSLSFSFANGRVQGGTVERVTVVPAGNHTSLGIESVPVEKWIDLDDEAVTTTNKAISATDVVAIGDTHANFTLPAPVYVAYSAANGWSYAGANTRSFLRTYLDDGGTGASITVDNVPFTKYDVIVYLATDTSGVKFLPVTVNGIKYKGTTAGSEEANDGDTWGTSCQDVANLGNNALRVNGLETATLTIKGSSNSSGTGARCGIAAFQIIQAEDGAIRESAYQPSISVNMKGNVNTIVGTSGTSGLLPVPNAYWNELQTSADSGGSETIGALRDAVGETTSLSIGATYAGGAWSQASAGRNTLGDMANGYRDTKQLTLTAVPYSSYDLILYFGSDLNGGSAKPWTPVQVTDVNGESKWYSYPTEYAVPENGAAQAADENPGDWGTTADCHTADAAVAYGKAVMKIADLSGDVTLAFPRNTDDNGSANRSGLYGFQIVCTGEEIVPPPPSINVNFADVMTPNAQGGTLSNPDADIPATAGTYGLAPAPGNTWANLRPATTGTDGTETVTTAYACVLDTPVRVSYKASGTYEYTGFAEAPVDAVLRYYLDDGTSQLNGTADGVQRAGADIYVTNIPFSKYDVIVYLATDNGEVFTPVEINGKLYKGAKSGAEEALLATDTWGTAKQTTPALGVNALRVSGLKGNLRIKGGTRQNKEDGKTAYARSGIAAFQIVLADDGEILETVDPDRGVLSLNFNSNRAGNTAVPDTDDFYGLDAVPGRAWYDSSAQYGDTGSSAIDKTEFVNVAYGSVLELAPQVTISAANGYGYSSSDPFMRAYLDDNSPGVTLSAEVPYEYYDVIVYSATDNTNSRFQAVGVNGTDYRWRDDQGKPVVAGVGELFGYGGRDAAFGQNAQRINGQTANPLTIAPRERNGSYRSGIAAIQIIERPVQEIAVNTEMTAQQVFAQALPGRATKLAFAEGGALTGAVNLSGVAVDLTQVAASPFSGALTVDANTKLYLPAGTRTYALTTGTVAGTLAAANVFIGGTAIPAGAMTQNGASLTFDIEVTYNWTGAAGDNLWSTPDNWSSGVVPGADSEVTVSLNANDAKTIVIDTAEATANLFYISGPSSGSATLEIVAAENVEGAKLTVVDKMFTTGNVTVTQNANIDVAGTSQMGDGSPIPANLVVQAGFQVNGSATYTVESGALVVQVPDRTVGDVSVSNGATLEVSAGGTLTAARVVVSYYGNSTEPVIRTGTLRIAGQATFSTQVAFRNEGLTMELAGGTMTTPSVSTYNGLAVSAASTLAAPEVGTLTVSGTNTALTGAGSLTLQGTVVFSSTITATYTGELTAAADSTVTLGENRPKLSVAEDATVNITPTAEEQAAGRIAFGTSMAAVPTATFTVEGVDAVTPAVDNGTLTLSWAASTATLSTTGNWSAFNWTVGETTGQAAPTSGVVVLDGTAEDGITVTLDTAIPAAITTINVRGDVTLVAKEQQLTLPTCINVEDGATLGVDANFAKANGSAWPDTWDIPANTTLRVTGDSFDFGGITVDNNGYIQVYADLEVTATGTEGTPAVIEPSANLWCRGKVTVSGDYVTLRKLYWLDDVTDGLTVTGDNVTIEGLRQVDGTEGLTLSGNNVTITGDVNDFAFAAGATITSSGTGNVLDGLTDLPTELHVTGGDLTIDSCATLGGALLTNGATLKLASDWASEQELKVSAGDNSATTLDLSAINPANRPTLNRYSDTHKTLPKTIIVAPSVEETEAGVIDITLLQDLVPAADTVVQVVAEPAWNPAWEVVTEGGKKLRITNVVLKPVLPEGSTLSEAATAALNAAAEQAGITGEYAVAITTGGVTVQVTTAEAATQLQEVLECFTGLTLKASTESGNTVTVVYDFGIVGIKRNTTGDGWVVTAKVQGANAEAGFAEGNVYTLTVNGTEVSVAGATVGEGGTVTLPLADTEVQGDGPLTLGVKVSRPEPTPAQ